VHDNQRSRDACWLRALKIRRQTTSEAAATLTTRLIRHNVAQAPMIIEHQDIVRRSRPTGVHLNAIF